jgi:hypothetical protein
VHYLSYSELNIFVSISILIGWSSTIKTLFFPDSFIIITPAPMWQICLTFHHIPRGYLRLP